MRKADREVTDIEGIVAILYRCEVISLALSGDEFPYVVPLNFGLARDGDRLWLYFHGAQQGTKLDLLRRNAKAAFEAHCDCSVVGSANSRATAHYKSVAGHGVLAEVSGDEKRAGIRALMEHYFPGQQVDVPDAALEATAILRLDVLQITGKQNPGPA